MPKRSSILDQAASNDALVRRLLEVLSSADEPNDEGLSLEVRHLIAVALGRRGGLKGGKARAKTLSAKKRSAIAKKAATARWGKRPKK